MRDNKISDKHHFIILSPQRMFDGRGIQIYDCSLTNIWLLNLSPDFIIKSGVFERNLPTVAIVEGLLTV